MGRHHLNPGVRIARAVRREALAAFTEFCEAQADRVHRKAEALAARTTQAKRRHLRQTEADVEPVDRVSLGSGAYTVTVRR